MEIVFLSEACINNSDLPRGSKISAERIWKNVKVDYVTSKHVAFSCNDPLFKSKHSVLYFSEKNFPECWNCDCKWFSLKNKFCKHIIAVFLRLDRDKNFLKGIKKTYPKECEKRNQQMSKSIK